jgi:hypothetical protein
MKCRVDGFCQLAVFPPKPSCKQCQQPNTTSASNMRFALVPFGTAKTGLGAAPVPPPSLQLPSQRDFLSHLACGWMSTCTVVLTQIPQGHTATKIPQHNTLAAACHAHIVCCATLWPFHVGWQSVLTLLLLRVSQLLHTACATSCYKYPTNYSYNHSDRHGKALQARRELEAHGAAETSHNLTKCDQEDQKHHAVTNKLACRGCIAARVSMAGPSPPPVTSRSNNHDSLCGPRRRQPVALQEGSLLQGNCDSDNAMHDHEQAGVRHLNVTANATPNSCTP